MVSTFITLSGSSVIDEKGKFVPDVILLDNSMSFHILNYNSPGATGALPFSVYIIKRLEEKGFFKNEQEDGQCGPWRFGEIVENLHS